MNTGLRWVLVLPLLIASLGEALAQSQGIYSCVDRLGRKLTADRPIIECMDRDQKILSPSGTVKGILSPQKTAKELTEQETQKKKEAEIQVRMEEDKKRDRALINRYANKADHDKIRAEALAEISKVREMVVKRLNELMAQRDKIEAELEFYKSDPAKAPLSLRRRVEENTRSLSEQRLFIARQDKEVVRTNARFDEELTRLKPQWEQRSATAK